MTLPFEDPYESDILLWENLNIKKYKGYTAEDNEVDEVEEATNKVRATIRSFMMDPDDNIQHYYEEVYTNDFEQIYNYCMSPTIKQTVNFMFVLLMHNLIFHFVTKIFCRINDNVVHAFSTIIGLVYIYMFSFYGNIEALFIIPLVYSSYYALYHLEPRPQDMEINSGITIGATFASILISCEFYYPDHEAWLKVRSIVMIAMMKVISLAFEVYRTHHVPSLLEYSGYMWCPANSVLGPWVTFKEYNRGNKFHTVNLGWVITILKYFIIALVFVCFSNCINTYFITDDNNVYMIAFRQALTFRMSHYFISYIGSAAMVTAGYSNDPKQSYKMWSYTIAKPLEIELPRSLASVVVNWNLSTHMFLKKYIFPVFLPYGQFVAILMTFLVSAMLHGLSVEVSIVLLTLGIFSYSQTKFQDRFAGLLDACIRVRPCRNCKHFFRCDSILVKCFNIMFTILTMIFLTYVGCLMEDVDTTRSASTIMGAIFVKWSQLQGIGHFLAGICIAFSWALA